MQLRETVAILAGGIVVVSIAVGIRVGQRALGRPAAVTSGSPDGGASPRDVPVARDVPGVIAPPPLIYLTFLVAAAILEALVPVPIATSLPLARYVTGGVLVIAGLSIIVAGAQRFRAAGTNIPPDLPTTALVVDGIYRWSRNPLYLAMALVYSGLGAAAGSLWTFVLLVPLLLVMNIGVISREEGYLEKKFGDTYRAYTSRVRRWV